MRWCIFTHQELLDIPSLWSLPIQGDRDVVLFHEMFQENYLLFSILQSETKPTADIKLSYHKFVV